MGVMAERMARARDLLLPWSGLLGGWLGWFLSQQVGSDQSFDNCQGSPPLLVLLIGLLGLVVAGLGAWLALPIWRQRRADHGTRRFIAGTGIVIAALFGIAIILQAAASLIIPPCYG
jgi:hypothetical protein